MDLIRRGFRNALLEQGVSFPSVRAKIELLHELSRAVGDRDPHLFWVPGRIEVVGKHTDYGGGLSLVAAVDRGFCVAAVPRRDDRCNITDVVSRETIACPVTAASADLSGWGHYAAAVARRVALNFGDRPLRGAEIWFASDLPKAAGLSSSSALMIAIFLVLDRINALSERPAYQQEIHTTEDLAAYLGCVENGQSFGSLVGERGVGTQGGAQDHTAILCARPGHLTQFGYRPTVRERDVYLPDELVFVIASSGVRAIKTAGAMAKYNAVAERLTRVLDLWNRERGTAHGSMMQAIAQTPDARGFFQRTVKPKLDRLQIDRYEQFVRESLHVVPAAAEALAAGNIDEFAAMVRHSQTMACEKLHNQIGQTDALVAKATAGGAVAASAFGAGFGGSVWALVRREVAAPFLERWRIEYAEEYPEEAKSAEFFATACGPAAMEI